LITDLTTDMTSNALRITNLVTSNVDIWSNLASNVDRIEDLETNGIISNSSSITSVTQGDLIYASADSTLQTLTLGATAGHVLKVSASGIPEWAAETSGGGGQWAIVNTNDIHYSAGNVGIGTITPNANLDVIGSATVSNAATIGTTKTFVVTVGSGGSGNYFIDDVERPLLELHQGQTYIFDMSDGTNNGHPLAFSTAFTGSSSSYTTGVVSNHGTVASGNAGSKVTFSVPLNAPSSIYYYCTVHGAGMGSTGTASSISSAAELIVSGSVTALNIEATGKLRTPVFTSDPATATSHVGDIYFNSAFGVIRYYNGSSWNSVSNASPVTTGGTVVISSQLINTSLTYNLGIDFEDDQDSDTQLTYTLSSGTLPTGSSLPSAGASTMSGTLTTTGTFNFAVQATDTESQTIIQSYQLVVTQPAVGQQTFSTAGTSTWVAPSGVTSVSVVCVGGGGAGGYMRGSGGAGGGLAYKNNITVVPGNSYTVTVGRGGYRLYGQGSSAFGNHLAGAITTSNGVTSSFSVSGITVSATGGQHGCGPINITVAGQPVGGGPSGTYDGGGTGGTSEGSYSYNSSSTDELSSGGGGAGGYDGAGGKGAGSLDTNGVYWVSATAGASSGGGGGGGGVRLSRTLDASTYAGAGGGGVGLSGRGTSGSAGTNYAYISYNTVANANNGGGGGSGGARGDVSTVYREGGDGGLYGGGGGPGVGKYQNTSTYPYSGFGGAGGVRIIWGTGRSFPVNAA